MSWITKRRLVLLLIASLALTSGCVTRASLARDFEKERNDCVGRTFMDPASWWCGWSQAIAESEVDANTVEYEIARDDMGRCRWIYSVDRASRQVTAWRYASGQEDCFNRVNWLGPW